MSALHAYLVSALVITACAYPMFLDPAEDGYPLSTFPMFSWNRGSTAHVTSAVAIGPAGERAVPPAMVGNAEAMQALQTLKKTVRAGPRATRDLCGRIARRVGDSGDADFQGATHVAIVTQKVESIAYLAGRTEALSRRLHTRCPITRGGL